MASMIERWMNRFDEQLRNEPWWASAKETDRWNAYLVDGDKTRLQNLFGLTDPDQIRHAENLLAESAALQLGFAGIPRSWDFNGLAEINQRLFDRMYAWAGQPRTVDLGTATGARFLRWPEAPFAIDDLADRLHTAGYFAGTSVDEAARGLAETYAQLNQAHPFREGNGRTNRAYTAALAADAGHQLHWGRVTKIDLDHASAAAHTGDLTPLTEMFQTALTPDAPARDAERAMRLSEALAIAFPPLDPGGLGGPPPATPTPNGPTRLRGIDGGRARHR
ncbi:hypothetical protein CGZ98_06135 [Enemella evansiae]|uniref:Fic/DOC family protein n=1 Tax=Enemella evansiae TaxID=2016499 RepID=UPI000B960F07|nr:Fic family protein [Enemella evansiae]OYO13121.1 hypothetical protein CGZ98_06135 [Enemella evansiae]